MTLHQLKIFAAVAKVGSFTQVAKNLRLSQPSVSLLIQGLQRELGVKLFERLGNKVHLTEAGRRVLQLAEGALALIEKIPEEIDEVKGLRRVKLRVGGSPIPAASFLPRTIQKFQKKYPGIKVAFEIHRSEVLEKALLVGEIDLALLGWPPDSEQLLAEPVHEEELVVIAPPNHPLTKKRSVTLELLSKEPLIVSRRGMRPREMVEKAFADKGIVLTPWMEIGPQFAVRDAVRNAVASGLGIGFIAKCHVAGDIKAKRVKVLKVPEINLKWIICLGIHKNLQNSTHVQAFREFLKKDLE